MRLVGYLKKKSVAMQHDNMNVKFIDDLQFMQFFPLSC